MTDPIAIAMTGAFALTGIAATSIAALKGWSQWIDLKRLELAAGRGTLAADSFDVFDQMQGDRGHAPTAGRIEFADLKERIRKLEAIAAGIDL